MCHHGACMLYCVPLAKVRTVKSERLEVPRFCRDVTACNMLDLNMPMHACPLFFNAPLATVATGGICAAQSSVSSHTVLA